MPVARTKSIIVDWVPWVIEVRLWGSDFFSKKIWQFKKITRKNMGNEIFLKRRNVFAIYVLY